ncbi:DUF3159 domain-containing protein [Kitasatospora sp. NPDC004240]
MSKQYGGESAAHSDLAAADGGPARQESPEDIGATLMQAFGGVRGMVETTLPGLVFIVLFNITHKIPTAALAAVGLTVALVLVRLVTRGTTKHAFGGLFGVALSAAISMFTGKAENFYLPGLLYSVGYCIALAVSALTRWPLIGVIVGPATGEMFTWRTQNPGRLAAYTKATWAWVVIMGIKPLILFPLYFTGNVNLLGWLKVALGIPPMLLAIYVTWQILLKAPPPIKAEIPGEGEPAEQPAVQEPAARD